MKTIDVSPTKIPWWNWSYKRISPERRAGLFGEKSDKLSKASRGSAECLDSVAPTGAVGAGRGTICRSASGGWHLSWSKPKGWLWDAVELILNQSFYDFLIFHAFGKKCKLNYVWCTQTDCWRAKTYFSSVFLETWFIYVYIIFLNWDSCSKKDGEQTQILFFVGI